MKKRSTIKAKTIKTFLSDKVTSNQKIALIEKEEIVMGDDNIAEIFANIVSILNIEGYLNCDPLASNFSDPVLKCILKYRIHPSILAIEEVYNKNGRLTFTFSKQRDEVLSDILKLETSKTCQDSDTPRKIVKKNADIFANVLTSNFNDSIRKCKCHRL